MKQLTIVKVGGNVIDDGKSLNEFLLSFSKINGNKILVHGGGKLATQLSSQLGIETKMVDGRRITDAETLKITTMVYAGWINKSITAILNSKNCGSIGLCGADLFLIPSEKRKKITIDYGFVGDVLEHKINTRFLELVLGQNIVPVIAPLTSDQKGQLLNTNADTVASSLAVALSKNYNVKLIYSFEKDGVLNGENVISVINPTVYDHLKKEKIIIGGMIPKLDNAFLSIRKGVKEVVIMNSSQLSNQNAGTRITN
jgi:acetylglutamate kinase